MKKIYILLLALFLGISACQRSQFATTTRHSSNGKVTFVKHYSAERSRSSKVKLPKHQLNEVKAQNNLPAPLGTVTGNLPVPEITTINPAPISENKSLIASTSKGTAILILTESTIIPGHHPALPDKTLPVVKSGNSKPDSLKNNVSENGKSKPHFAKIKFKDGHEEIVKILYQNQDTLKYRLINESDSVRMVMMDKVEKILPDPRKTEKLGLAGFILSILGLIPFFGIPFAILALIFGLKSLRKIKKFPERYKGKGFAKASAIIGGLELIFYIIFALVSIVLAISAVSISAPSCSMRIA